MRYGKKDNEWKVKGEKSKGFFKFYLNCGNVLRDFLLWGVYESSLVLNSLKDY